MMFKKYKVSRICQIENAFFYPKQCINIIKIIIVIIFIIQIIVNNIVDLLLIVVIIVKCWD